MQVTATARHLCPSQGAALAEVADHATRSKCRLACVQPLQWLPERLQHPVDTVCNNTSPNWAITVICCTTSPHQNGK